MSNVWLALPSAMPAQECNAALSSWRLRGYKLAIFRDPGTAKGVMADLVVEDQYKGWYAATNRMYREVMAVDPLVQWIVAGGDDMTPDPTYKPDQIAQQCTDHFQGTFGVMQPIGDPWAPDERGLVAAERICGSPWIGVDFIRRYNGGQGVWPEDYRHFFGDEQLREELIKTPYLWQRQDLCHFHSHWLRVGKQPPMWMSKMSENWQHDENMFGVKKAAGFPRLPTLPCEA